MQHSNKMLKLKNEIEIPIIGLGVWQIPNTQVAQAVTTALQAGYRHIDTARAYRNEEGVGKAIRESGIPRNEIFVTTKLAVFDFFTPEKSFNDSLKRLGLDYVDLYLLHWPFLNWKSAWKVLEKLYKQGKAKSIGVSNFSIRHLDELEKMGGEMPHVNQVEISPFLSRNDLVEYCQAKGIVVEAYSPLTRGKRLQDPTIANLAKSYNKSSAQIMLRWGIQHNLVMLPKSQTKSHIKSNLDVFNFEISAEDMQKLDALNENYSALLKGWSRK